MVSKLRESVLGAVVVSLFLAQAVRAEETLSSLQQDVVLAKEKHDAIVGKMGSVNNALDNTKANLATKESDHLVAIVENNETPSAPPMPVRVLPAVPEVKKKTWNWPKLNFNLLPYAQPQKIAEGDALYKVAISDNKISVQEAIEIALANNLQLQADKKNIEVADAKLTEAKRGLFPTVQAVTEINGGKVSGRFYRGDNQKLNVSQPLYYGGELDSTVKQAEENVLVSKTEYKKSYNEFVHQVRVAYYGVLKAEYNAQYQIELFEKISQLMKQLNGQREQKLFPEVDYLNVESQYYQVLYQVEASKNDVLSAGVTLKQLMGLEVEETVPVDLKIDFIKLHPDFNELLARALENNADIRIKIYTLEAAKYGLDVYESRKKPHFDLRGSYGMLGEAFHDTRAIEHTLPGDADANIDPEKEWFLGIHGSMPLGASSVEYDQIKHVYGPTVLALTGSEDWRHHVAFNLLDRLSAVTDEKSAQYAFLRAESDYQTAKNEITLRLRDEYYNLQKYLIQINSSVAKLHYQEKQSGILEYLLSVQEAVPSNYVENLVEGAQDKYAFIQAVADYNVSLSSVSVLIGDTDYFDNLPLLEKLNQGKNDAVQGV